MRIRLKVDPDACLQPSPEDHPLAGPWLAKRKDQWIEVELRDGDQVRSDRQNRYFHGPVCDHVADLWFRDGWVYYSPEGIPLHIPKDAVKDTLVAAFGPGFNEGPMVKTPLGRGRRSTASYTVREFKEMLDRINEYCTHKEGHRAPLPKPEEWDGE